MKEKFLRYVYKKYKKELEEMFIESYYGFIPSSVREPSLDFMASARTVLESFFSIQAYNIQKRAIQDSNNTDKYNGMLIHIRSLLAAIQRGKLHKEEFTVPEKVEDPLSTVNEFTENLKNYGKK